MAAHCSGCVCSLLCVCTSDGIIVEHKFRVWVAVFHVTFHFYDDDYDDDNDDDVESGARQW